MSIRTMEIYYDDLNENAQARLLVFEGVESPDELNWEISPLCILERENEDEDGI